MGCIYQAENIINGKLYIGKTIMSLDKRIKAHRYLMVSGSKYCFYQAMNKYGFNNFKWKILFESFDEKKLSEMEMKFIKELKTKVPFGYNLTDGGEGQKGYHHTAESKLKIGIASIGRKKTPEGIENIRKSKIGIPLSQQHKEKLKKARSKRIITNETKEKLRIAGTGRVFTKETIDKIRKSREGYRHSPETLEKLKGHPVSIETRDKLRKLKSGTKLSEATKIKISESIKNYWIARKTQGGMSDETRLVGTAC